MAFLGTSKVTLDSKGRFAVPTRYRPLIAAEAMESSEGKPGRIPMVITRGRKRELWLLTKANWEILYAGVSQLSVGDAFRRRIELNAEPVEVDGNGRLLIPAGLREKGLLPNATLAFMGAGKHFEIWDWDEHLRDEEEEQAKAEASAANFNF